MGGLALMLSTAKAEETGLVSAGPELKQFVQRVVEANPRVKAASAALDASVAYRDAAARPLYNPELSLGAESSDTDTRELGISQTIDWNGKRTARTLVADSDRLLVEAEYLATRWSVTVELLEGLSLHQIGLEREALAESSRLLMHEFADLAQRRFDAGDLNQVEFELARLAATQASIQKAIADAGLAEARQAVMNLTPIGNASHWPTLPAQLPNLPTRLAEAQTLIQNLPEVRAAQHHVESADASVQLRRRERRPDPTLSLAGGTEDGETLIGVNISIPLFVRNRFDNEVVGSMAELDQAEQVVEDVIQRAHARLISASERYQLSRSAWEQWQATGQASLASQSEELKRLWEAGELSTTDYLVQLRQTLDVQESALELRDASWRAWFEWLRAAGQLDIWLGQGAVR